MFSRQEGEKGETSWLFNIFKPAFGRFLKFMLPKNNRIKRAVFDEAFQKGKSVYSPFLNLKFHKAEAGSPAKFSFVTSKNVSKKASDRNLLRRRGYSVIKDNSLKIKDSFECIFFFKKDSMKMSFKDLEKDILFLLKKADVLK